MRLAVIGAGAAGTAAGWWAAQHGAKVTLFCDRAGASALYSGALDLRSWEENGPPEALEPELMRFVMALGVWKVGPSPCRIATLAGLARPARGRDTALLDLLPLAGRRVAVADTGRDDWDAPRLSAALSRSAWASATGTRFDSVAVDAIQHGYERRIAAADFALLHDNPKRLEALGAALRHASVSHDAWLVGPWLGMQPETVERLRVVLHMPVGETTSPPGGPAGARFEAARDRLLAETGVALQQGRITAIQRAVSGWVLQREAEGGGAAEEIDAERVVLCVGGVAAGGIRVTGPGVRRSGTGFALSLQAPVRFELDGRELDAVSTPHGIDLVTHGMEALERVGVAVTNSLQVRGESGLFAAGDITARHPRTALEAARTGIAAARAALR